MKVLNCSGLIKSYKKNQFELSIDDFSIGENNTFALLGPNGSGKTTFLKLIMDLISLDRGEINILGKNSLNKLARVDLAYLPEKLPFPVDFTARQVLFYYTSIYRSDYKVINEQIESLATSFKVDYLEQKIKSLSKGMKQTIGLISTFLDRKKLYILDEPFNGLDAVQKEIVLDYIQCIKKNSAIIITTHTTSDIEDIYDEAYLIKKGRFIDKKNKQEVDKVYNSLKEYYLNYFK